VAYNAIYLEKWVEAACLLMLINSLRYPVWPRVWELAPSEPDFAAQRLAATTIDVCQWLASQIA
jgi:hypothetical protein